jgi:hypothetical protein
MSDSPLARYQSALLALFLRDDLNHDARLERLREDPAFAPYASYVASFDPAFVEQGVRATQHWGRATKGAGRAARRGPRAAK